MLAAQSFEMKKIDNYAINACGISGTVLMENAAKAIVHALVKRYENLGNMRCTVACGGGNNGGDGFAAAVLLCQKGVRVTIVSAVSIDKIKGDSAYFYEKAREKCIPILQAEDPQTESALSEAEIIIDALYGTGFKGELFGGSLYLVGLINKSKGFVISADIPSGAVCDTGQIGNDCVKAKETVTFSLPKPCHFLYPSASFCGNVTVSDIGIPLEAIEKVNPSLTVITRKNISEALPRRRADSHKGDCGKVLLFCGSHTMPGAAVLALSGALYTGAGLLHLLASKQVCQSAAAHLAEPVYTFLTEDGSFDYLKKDLDGADAVLIGCGLGLSEKAKALTEYVLLNTNAPVIVDGDGITHLSRNINILYSCADRLILTPHPGEMARLLGQDTENVQKNRIDAAKGFAKKYGCTVCLKGAGTVIALPDDKAFINTTGSSALSKGGSGDVLAGMIASFAAQKVPNEKAAMLGVWLHGAAGERLAQRFSEYGVRPSDIPFEAAFILSEIEKGMVF